MGDGLGVGVSGLTLEKCGPGHPEKKRDVIRASRLIEKHGQWGRMDHELLEPVHRGQNYADQTKQNHRNGWHCFAFAQVR